MTTKKIVTDHQYSKHMANILKNGKASDDRTGTGTRRLMGLQMRFNLQEGFPFVTTKKVSLPFIARELAWMMSGNTSQEVLKNVYKCSIWDEWADEFGRLGPVYGAMFRRRPAANIQMVEVAVDKRKGRYLTSNDANKIIRAHFSKNRGDDPAFMAWARMIRVVAESNKKVSEDKRIPEALQRVSICQEWLDYDKFAVDFYSLPGCELVQKDNEDSWFFFTNNAGKGLFAKDTLQIVESYKHSLVMLAAVQTYTLHEAGNYDRIIVPRFYIDQMAEAIHQLKTNRTNRRIIVDAWEPSYLPKDGLDPTKQAAEGLMALAPCHCMFQFFAVPQERGQRFKLNLQLYQRSADWCLGVPYNIAFYALLMHIVARECDLDVGELIWTGGDCHIYSNHIETAMKQSRRKCRPLPQLELDPSVTGLDSFSPEKAKLVNYVHGPVTTYPVAV